MEEEIKSNFHSENHEINLDNIVHNLNITMQCLNYISDTAMGNDSEICGSRKKNEETKNKLVDIENNQLINKKNIRLHVKRLENEVSSLIMSLDPKRKSSGNSTNPLTITNKKSNNCYNEQFRYDLVSLMMEAVKTWELNTKKTKIELAEESKIWRVSIDDGRLRVRSMERYLGIGKLPKNPRWRDVVNTVYFILDNVTLSPFDKKKLNKLLEVVLEHTRRRAL